MRRLARCEILYIIGFWVMSLVVLPSEFRFLSLVFMIVSIVPIVIFIYHRVRLHRLKRDGERYKANAVDIVYSHSARVRGGFFKAGRVQCLFGEGVQRIATSGYYMISINAEDDGLYAIVYFSKTDPSQYEVEVFRD
ncbi:MAG: hypothetical protein FWB98_04145 [Defluviitaleaceae bacterium]|nr:hypothetical protein [Defluviitaleaceae bacterium]